MKGGHSFQQEGFRFVCSLCKLRRLAKSCSGFELPGRLVELVPLESIGPLGLSVATPLATDPGQQDPRSLIVSWRGGSVCLATSYTTKGQPFTWTMLRCPCLGDNPDWPKWFLAAVAEELQATRQGCPYCEAGPGHWCLSTMGGAIQVLHRLRDLKDLRKETKPWAPREQSSPILNSAEGGPVLWAERTQNKGRCAETPPPVDLPPTATLARPLVEPVRLGQLPTTSRDKHDR